MGNKKKIAKFLRQEAAKLAPEEYQAYHRYNEVQYHKDGDQAYPVYGEIQKHPVNHARRLKRLYQKYGKDAVSEYFNKRGFKLVSKDEYNIETPTVREVGRGTDSQSDTPGKIQG